MRNKQSGWKGYIVGSIGANMTTSKGGITRYQRQNGAYWGVNGYGGIRGVYRQ